MASTSHLREKVQKVTLALESLYVAQREAEQWFAELKMQVPDLLPEPDWFSEFVRQTTVLPIPILERELVRLDMLMDVDAVKYPELLDNEIDAILSYAHMIKFALTHKFKLNYACDS